ncbi:phosphoribosylglycinamide formyltransferase [Synechocystis salina]|uniref:Phosphoribosylglycinamide formyltransferase n=1 Tax=Synechocystis salina LEGE 00031 TaxID=1828736 RepID=A0ABR9VPX0_9SYNC|nr:phosphoribosylglycinamide formyltransferase [Synechocystis salina]MBE9240266.1 phosphoribosylglycinamide formyltransferase [Synechocystis salina LEGE 00041]MBE9253367.1 phosphoribosylglycinamide formyltransferase [Synechocystis salina LEGE 00031]
MSAMSDLSDNLSFISPPIALENIPQPRCLSLGVMASGSGSNFEAIARAIKEGNLNGAVKLVIYNNPDAGVKQRAMNHGVPHRLLNHRDYASREALDQDIVEHFRQAGVEWVIMAGWMRIVTPVLLDAFSRRVLNIHPSLLPSFRGVRAVEQALAAGVKVSGCTVHYAEATVDSGPIVAQAVVPILPHDTGETLHQRIQVQEHRLFPLAIALAAQPSP